MKITKNIDEEIKEANRKTKEIEGETDTNEKSENSKTISDIILNIYNKQYNINDLVKMTDKKSKTLEEVEIVKKFKLLIKNYYEGISYAVLRKCCGKTYTIDDLKAKLKDEKTYKLIEIRCSRNNIKFNKETVNIILNIVEKYELN